MTETLRVAPWQHLVVDDFLSHEVLVRAEKDLAETSYQFDIEPRGTGRIEYSLLESTTLWRAIYSTNLISLLKEAFEVQPRLNKGNMLQLRRMNGETPEFPIHSDYTSGGETIAAFLYISDDWTEARGGRLCLYKSEDAIVPSAFVEPIRNRLVAFRTSRDHWHSVERVRGWERMSVLSMWDIVDAD